MIETLRESSYLGQLKELHLPETTDYSQELKNKVNNLWSCMERPHGFTLAYPDEIEMFKGRMKVKSFTENTRNVLKSLIESTLCFQGMSKLEVSSCQNEEDC